MAKFSVYQHWDTLRVCVVGRSYPPEFYSWIQNPRVRSLFERIAIETEEDYQKIIRKLESFGVEILRPNLPRDPYINGQYLPPPMTPRDYMCMIGDVFYKGYQLDFSAFYQAVRDESWPDCDDISDLQALPEHIQIECREMHNLDRFIELYSSYDHIFDRIARQGNTVKPPVGKYTIGASVSRIGRDLYFGTETYHDDMQAQQKMIDREFNQTRNHIINTGGHADSTFCPVCPGLIISLYDVPTYRDTFPGWEVVYLPAQSWHKVEAFMRLKNRNRGKWWIPGFEDDQDVINTVEIWLNHWTGYVEETVFDVNMLIIDPKNVIVFNENQQVFEALSRYGITPHVIPFRHRYFWDGGIHCVTSDLDRAGTMQDFFPDRPAANFNQNI